jgi:hypothetical protein
MPSSGLTAPTTVVVIAVTGWARAKGRNCDAELDDDDDDEAADEDDEAEGSEDSSARAAALTTTAILPTWPTNML